VNRKKKINKLFLVVWDMYGLESIHDLTKLDRDNLFAVLKDESANNAASKLVHYNVLRARANSQRCYEIYTVQTDPGISIDDLVSLFNSDPQAAAELIRSRGNKIYSDRSDRKVVIT
jgi:hypothetical protein